MAMCYDLAPGVSITRNDDNTYLVIDENKKLNQVFDQESDGYADIKAYFDCIKWTEEGNRPSDWERKFESLREIFKTEADLHQKIDTNRPNAERVKAAIENLIMFFREFDFEPNFRFVNTIVSKAAESKANAISYISNYFDLMDNLQKEDIKQKMLSPEFDDILNNISVNGVPKNIINKRFRVYYGSAGCGKTTRAMKESNNNVIVCNNSMLPNDLMENFVFKDGKPEFQKSDLWLAMENGTVITLDEINLLPFESLRFLQGILDNKKSFEYKGKSVVIKDGFKVISTMNLSIGGATFGLPEPLVDRAEDIVDFHLTADMLMDAIF